MAIASFGKAFTSSLGKFSGMLKARPKVVMTKHIRKIQMHDRKMTQKMRRAQRTALIRQAAYCRTVARRSLKMGKKGQKNSPGKAPLLRSGKLFRHTVQWGYNSRFNYAVVGPVQISNRNVPAAMERGGMSTAVKRMRKRPNKITKSRGKRSYREKRKRNRSNAKLKFQTAQRGPTQKYRQRVKKHPFMVPAQQVTLAKFAGQFRGTFK